MFDFIGQLNVLASIPVRHPQVGDGFVGLCIHPAHGVGDPLAVGRELRAVHVE